MKFLKEKMNWLDAGNYLKIVAQGIFTSLDFAVASVLAESFRGIIFQRSEDGWYVVDQLGNHREIQRWRRFVSQQIRLLFLPQDFSYVNRFELGILVGESRNSSIYCLVEACTKT